jgi:hypothetical protein
LLSVLLYVLFVCKCVLPPGDNPIAVNKYIIPYHSLTHAIHLFIRASFYNSDSILGCIESNEGIISV